MLDFTTLVWVAGSAVACFVIEKLTLEFSLNRGLLSNPNARSSHTQPTPSIGGVAIVIPVLAYCLSQGAEDARFYGILFSVLLLAVTGFWDDLKPLPSRLRLLVQIFVVVFSILFLPLELVSFDQANSGLILVAGMVLALCMLWCVNLFNFMDGIDGLAASQCLVYCLACLLLAREMPPELYRLIWVLCTCSLVFLFFNWPPARIFMGDVGSGPLGYVIVVIALMLNQQGILSLLVSLILFSVFWVDASYTLIRRIVSGQAFTSAHRSHLYQKLAIRSSHQKVTMAFCVYSVLVLLPLAGGAIQYPSWGIMALGLACAPVLVLCIRFEAGLPDATSDIRPK